MATLKVDYRVATVQDLMFGGSGIGCLYIDVPMEQATATVEKALELGIKHFDTAPWYGAGLSEERFGMLLADKNVEIYTKVGRIIKPLAEVDDTKERVERGYSDGFVTDAYHHNIPVNTYTGPGTQESWRQSKQRLKRDKIKCLRVHDAENEERWAEATAPGGAVDTLVSLRQAGEIDECSLGMNDASYLLRTIRKYGKGTFDSIMMAGCWNLIDQSGLELLLECQEKGIRVTVAGIWGSGLLWGSTHYKYDSIPAEIAEKAKKWGALADQYGIPLPAVALQFGFLPSVVQFVAIGCKKPTQVESNCGLCGKKVPPQLWADAKAQGLMLAEIPLP